MELRELIVFVDELAETGNLLRVATILARKHGARLIGAYVPSDSLLRRDPDAFARGAGSAAAAAEYQSHEDESLSRAAEQFAEATTLHGVAGAWQAISCYATAADIVIHARYADLSIVGQQHQRRASLWGPEDILLSLGGPTLIVPEKPAISGPVGDRVLLAWNAAREARRAVGDALPILGRAAQVTVLIVDPPAQSAGPRPEAGANITRYLAAHGISSQLRCRSSAGVDIGTVILREAHDIGADMIVMGAYGHSRIVELVLGGATRTVLRDAEIPVLMSH
jgi:nucleotide-binding universal stress UspA family protein